MLLTQRQLPPFAAANFLFPSFSLSPVPNSLNFPLKSTNRFSSHKTWIAKMTEEPTTSTDISPEEGPVELYPSIPPIFSTDDATTPLQTATSVLFTGAIVVLLFRSFRRRAKRVTEMKFRSSGVKKSAAEEAMESLKAVSLSPANGKSPPSAIQAFLGALTAGVIAVILFKFTTTIEASLNRQTISDNYSIRQITITIRTIINGLCYLATFIFGGNGLGLFIYSIQLAFDSFMEDSISENEEQPLSDDTNSEDQSSENT